MKPSPMLGGWIYSCLFAAALFGLHQSKGAEEAPEKPARSTDPADVEACQRQLNRIYGALQEYNRRNHTFPARLADLMGNFLYDPLILDCPYVKRTGSGKAWRRQFGKIPTFEKN